MSDLSKASRFERGYATDYPDGVPHYLSLGAGVQSSTLALMAAAGEITPMPTAAIFADTQADPPEVYRWLDWLETRLPFPVHRVTAGSLEAAALTPHTSKKGVVYFRTAIPFFTRSGNGIAGRIKHRTCTRDYKLVPIFRYVNAEIGAKRLREWRKKHRESLALLAARNKYEAAVKRKESPPFVPFPFTAWRAMQDDALAVQWIGMSSDEPGRVKPARQPYLVSRHPLFDMRMTRIACLEWMRARGYPEPPRSACWFCPFRSNAEWRKLRDRDPESFALAVAFDRKARELRERSAENLRSSVYLHRDAVPLDQVDLRSDADRGQGTLWDEECEGMCGV